MKEKLVISGSLITLNEYIKKCRGNKYVAANAKKTADEQVMYYIMRQLKGVRFDKVKMDFVWYCKDKRQDPDNVCFAKKFILDALVKCGTIPNDGWKNVVGFNDSFEVDAQNPRIEVILEEV